MKKKHNMTVGERMRCVCNYCFCFLYEFNSVNTTMNKPLKKRIKVFDKRKTGNDPEAVITKLICNMYTFYKVCTYLYTPDLY